jgi:hypothetical protein
MSTVFSILYKLIAIEELIASLIFPTKSLIKMKERLIIKFVWYCTLPIKQPNWLPVVDRNGECLRSLTLILSYFKVIFLRASLSEVVPHQIILIPK